MKLHVGIIGLGTAWETWYAPALRAIADQFRIAAIYDPIAARANQAVRELSSHGWNADPMDGFHALIQREDIDAVLILSDQWIGALPIRAALESAKATYASLFDRNSIWNPSWRQWIPHDAAALFVPELPLRHAPATLRIKELIATHLGSPYELECFLPTADAAAGRFPNPGTAQSILLHYVDWCRDILGREPTRVVGQSYPASQDFGSEDRAQDRLRIRLDFAASENPETGPVACLCWDEPVPTGDWESGCHFKRIDFRITCERGIASVALPDRLVWSDNTGHHSEHLVRDRPIQEQLFIHFHQAVTHPLIESCGLEDCYRTIEIVRLAELSRTVGDRIEIGEKKPPA